MPWTSPSSSPPRGGRSISSRTGAGSTAACTPPGRTDAPRFPAYLDDHAFLLEAALRLLQTGWNPAYLDFAGSLAAALLERFEDGERGGFWFTAHDHERLMHRSKAFSDDSLPAGNGVAAAWLGRLGHLLGETRYLEAAERTILAARPGLEELPHAHGAMLTALEEYLEPPQTVVLRGRGESLEAVAEALRRPGTRPGATWSRFRTTRRTCRDCSARVRRARPARTSPTSARGHHCDAPIRSFEDLEAALDPLEAGGRASI